MNPQRLENWALSIGENTKAFVQKRLDTAEYPTNAYRGIIDEVHRVSTNKMLQPRPNELFNEGLDIEDAKRRVVME